MRLTALLFAAILLPGMAAGQTEPLSSAASSTPASASSAQDGPKPDGQPSSLPVSLERIREALAQPPGPVLRELDARPTFKIEIQERLKLDEILATLDVKSGPVPAGGLYTAEQQRLLWPSVDNPLRQPYAAFSQSELLTILVENLVGKYLAGRMVNALTAADRERAEAAAREDVRRAIAEFCVQQPDGGAATRLCSTPPR